MPLGYANALHGWLYTCAAATAAAAAAAGKFAESLICNCMAHNYNSQDPAVNICCSAETTFKKFAISISMLPLLLLLRLLLLLLPPRL
jgi:hypothetical protein